MLSTQWLALAMATPKSKKPPPNPNGNILNYFAKLPASNSASCAGLLGNTTETSPRSLKRSLEDEFDEGEERRAKLTKALEEEFGTNDPEEEVDDDLRSLFEEDLEDSTDAPAFQRPENPGILNANPEAETAEGASTIDSAPQAEAEAEATGCFMCGKGLGGLSESVWPLISVAKPTDV
jgi:hypothetical protein